jgi:hypothetical protein
MALFSPWLDLSIRLAGVFVITRGGWAAARSMAMPSSSTPSGEGDCPFHQGSAMVWLKIITRFAVLCHTGAMELAQVAATSLPDTSQSQLCQLRGFWQDGEGSLANSHNFRRRTSSLSPNLVIGLWQIFAFTQQYKSPYFIQHTFMLPLEVLGPGGSLSILLSRRLNSEMSAGECPGRRQWHHTIATGWRQCLSLAAGGL